MRNALGWAKVLLGIALVPIIGAAGLIGLLVLATTGALFGVLLALGAGGLTYFGVACLLEYGK